MPDSTILLAAKLSVCENSELLLGHSGSEHKVKFCFQLWHKNPLKVECFLDDGPSLLESFFEAIHCSHVVLEILQKSHFVVNGVKPI